MIEYHNLKLEYKTNYSTNNTTLDLSNLLLKLYNFDDMSICLKFIKQSIKNTNNPVEFLRKIEKGI